MPRPKKELQIPEKYPDFDKVKFGERFGNLLKEHGYTIESFSAASGMSDSMIKAIKRGSRAPGMENYIKIIEILHINEMELLRDSIAFSSESETKRIMLANELMPILDSMTLEQAEFFIKSIARMAHALREIDITERKDDCN